MQPIGILVYPYINYSIEIWGDTYDIHLNSIIKLQKKAVRIISGLRPLDNTEPVFKKLEILDIKKTKLA